MIKTLEKTGRTEDDAINAALAELGLDRDDVSVEILERAKSGREYEENGRGFRLARMENRLQLVTAGEYSDVVSRTLEKRAQPKLSPTALEVLAIVAYYQPVTRSYIEQLRGTDSSYTVALLSERGLIAPCGRLEAPGRPVLFGTTDQFLRVVGISSIEELPPLPNVATGEGIQELQAAIDAASDKDEQLKITEIE